MHITSLFSVKTLGIALALTAVFSLAAFSGVLQGGKPAALPGASAAAVDYFLKIDGIEGESQDKGHKNQIDVESWYWGMSSSGGSAGAGGGSGKVNPSDIVMVKRIDKASAKLMEACANGMHIPKFELELIKSAPQPIDYVTYTFENVRCTSYNVAGENGAEPTEELSFNYGKIVFKYKEQDAKGIPGKTHETIWDLEEGTTSAR